MIDYAIIDSFTPISLEELGKKVKLMNRIDTKFVTRQEHLEELLRRAADDYYIQQIDGESNMPYYTKYFDTQDVDMFYQHQRGKKNRQKIRLRLYERTETVPFIEVKTKNNKGRTRKKRIVMDQGDDINRYNEFLNLHTPYLPNLLLPRIENHFYRITLVNKDMTERITIDSNLEFHNLTTGNRVSLDNLGIIEWKRDGNNWKSGLDVILRDLRIRQSGFSKYCMGMALTDPALRQNRLKAKIRMINRLTPLSI